MGRSQDLHVEGRTREFLPGDPSRYPGEVEYLWSLADSLPADEYPVGLRPLPEDDRHEVRGTAGFPDGPGLVYPTGTPRPRRLPRGGVMFVGNNCDSDVQRQKKRRPATNGEAPPPAGDTDEPSMKTWKGFYMVTERAGVSPTQAFFTNVTVGLVVGKRNTGRPAGTRSFDRWCDNFLDHQIALMRPRLVVAMGQHAHERMNFPKYAFHPKPGGGSEFIALGIAHPSYYIRPTAAAQRRLAADCDLLRDAWAAARGT